MTSSRLGLSVGLEWDGETPIPVVHVDLAVGRLTLTFDTVREVEEALGAVQSSLHHGLEGLKNAVATLAPQPASETTPS